MSDEQPRRFKRVRYDQLPYAAEFSTGGRQRYIKLHTGHMKINGWSVERKLRANTPVRHYLDDSPACEVLRERAERVGGKVEDARQTEQSDRLVEYSRKRRETREAAQGAQGPTVPANGSGVIRPKPFVFEPPPRKGGK